MYEQEDLDKFFAACTPEEWLYFQFFLCTGMREQEVMHTYIRDISFQSSVVRRCPDMNTTCLFPMS